MEVGDIIIVKQDETFPADLLLLASSKEQGECFIATGSLDGEKNLKKRVQAKDMKNVFPNEEINEKDIFFTNGVIECEKPNKDLHSFSGQVIIEQKYYPLSQK